MIKQDILENQAKFVFLGIGSNLGLRKRHLEKAKFLLSKHNLHFTSVSSYYETPSWPDPKNPKFINIVLKALCTQNPNELIDLCKEIETKLGRKKMPKNSPRVCDIDIIDFKNQRMEIDLILPHPRMHTRNFVLLPLFEIDKDWKHPVLKLNIKKLISSLLLFITLTKHLLLTMLLTCIL